MTSTKTDNPKKDNRRKLRNFLIHYPFQIKYALWISALLVVLTAFNTSLFYNFIKASYTVIVTTVPFDDLGKLQLAKDLRQTSLNLTLFTSAFLIVSVLISIYISHRTAGPIYQLRKVISQVRSGNLNARAHFRPGDDFQELAQEFNQLLDMIEKDSA